VEISQEIPLRVRQAHRQAGFSTCSVHSGLPSVARLKVLLRCSGPLRPAGSLGQQAAKDMGHSFMCSPMQARASTGCSNVSPYLMVQAATSTSSPSHAKPTWYCGCVTRWSLDGGLWGLQLRKNRGLCTSLCTSLCRPSVVLHTATSQLFSPLLQKAEHRQRKQQTAEFEVVHCWVCCVQCVMDQRAGVACKAHRHVAQQRSMKAEPYSPPPYILVATHGHNRA